MNVIDQLDISPGHSVLDLGCGDGAHSKYARTKTSSLIVALDIDLSNLRGQISTIYPEDSFDKTLGLRGLCADAINLPFADESFDRVICSLVLYFLPFQAALIELSRVVKTGGRVYLRLPLLGGNRMIYILRTLISNPRLSMYHLLLTVNGFYYALSGRQISNPLIRNEHWVFYVPRRRFEQAVIKAGFSVDEYKIDQPAVYATAIDAWIRKI